jgi:hypothetical protein
MACFAQDSSQGIRYLLAANKSCIEKNNSKKKKKTRSNGTINSKKFDSTVHKTKQQSRSKCPKQLCQ